MNDLLKTIICTIFFTNILICSVIDHQLNNDVIANSALELQLFTDYNEESISNVNLFFRTNDQIVYLKEQLVKTSDNYYGITLAPELIIGQNIEYYFLVELSNSDFITTGTPPTSYKSLALYFPPGVKSPMYGVFL